MEYFVTRNLSREGCGVLFHEVLHTAPHHIDSCSPQACFPMPVVS